MITKFPASLFAIVSDFRPTSGPIFYLHSIVQIRRQDSIQRLTYIREVEKRADNFLGTPL